MKLTTQQKQNGIVFVFNDKIFSTEDIYMYLAAKKLDDEKFYTDYDRRSDLDDSSLIDSYINVKQELDEDEYVKYIEDTFCVTITLSYRIGRYCIYSDVDKSHVFENFDDKVGDFIFKTLPKFTRANTNGLSYENYTKNIDDAIEDFKILYKAFQGLVVSKTNIKYKI